MKVFVTIQRTMTPEGHNLIQFNFDHKGPRLFNIVYKHHLIADAFFRRATLENVTEAIKKIIKRMGL